MDASPFFTGTDLAGWCAGALMVATFWNRHPLRMRVLALATNVAFVVYGAGQALPPVLALHAVLMPINAWRLLQQLRARTTP